ncbi:MAG: DMT family transporter [Patescibacteria group bacterium]
MTWLPLTIGAYFLSALVSTFDKALMERSIPNPLVFAFYTGLASIGMILLAPLGLTILPASELLIALFVGVLYLASLYCLFAALSANDPSRVMPLVGGATPVFILLLAFVFFGEVARVKELLAVVFFIAGGALLALESRRTKIIFAKRLIILSLLSAFFLASSFFIAKELYKTGPFLSVFIWSRMGSVLAAIGLLFIPATHREIKKGSAGGTSSSGVLFLSNKVAGAVSLILLNYAVAIGPVATINALKGLEYFFVFLVTFILALFYPRFLHESARARVFAVKLTGIIIMSVGFGILAFI